jgi:hypothetical protein
MAQTSIGLTRIEPLSPPMPKSDPNTTGSDTNSRGDGADLSIHLSRQEFSLPPVGGCKGAWLFLAACFAVEALVWGMYNPLAANLVFPLHAVRLSSPFWCHLDSGTQI